MRSRIGTTSGATMTGMTRATATPPAIVTMFGRRTDRDRERDVDPRDVFTRGTLDLMVLRTLETMGPQHGFGLAKRILQISGMN